MTRVNVLDPELLTDQHLFAEYREITRIFALVKQACDKYPHDKILAKIPPTYRLNTGHVLFFYDKLGFIEKRYFALKNELIKREMNFTDKDSIVEFRGIIDPIFYQDFEPNETDLAVNCERIIEKIVAKPNWYKMNKIVIDDESYCQQLMSLSKWWAETIHLENVIFFMAFW